MSKVEPTEASASPDTQVAPTQSSSEPEQPQTISELRDSSEDESAYPDWVIFCSQLKYLYTRTKNCEKAKKTLDKAESAGNTEPEHRAASWNANIDMSSDTIYIGKWYNAVSTAERNLEVAFPAIAKNNLDYKKHMPHTSLRFLVSAAIKSVRKNIKDPEKDKVWAKYIEEVRDDLQRNAISRLCAIRKMCRKEMHKAEAEGRKDAKNKEHIPNESGSPAPFEYTEMET
ncbi:hypothetical protein FBEOM_1187 [Fusarium beomiforme]|uniref:Uncharacterized protein n=1 Tax=Fusarium beomiforme TaxID=44412 RepID=A0A9P5ATV0_9HYPO|nr:hypothetical protein FBEOM_1187 [Fusarium beomiforme]